MDNEVFEVLRYFAFFKYPPTADEIYSFLPKASKKAVFMGHLHELVREGKIVVSELTQAQRYLLPQQTGYFSSYSTRYEESQKKIKKVQTYLKLLKFIPSILFVSYSGSIALFNADKSGDVDFFIITKANQLWTGRFFAILLAQILGLRHPKLSYRVCLNLFFDEQELEVLKYKRNKYIAHEIVQIKLIFDKNHTYEKFLRANSWVYSFYPNTNITKIKLKIYSKRDILRLKGNPLLIFIEWLLKKLQLKILKRTLREEKLTKTQLWLFQKDFEKKIPEKLLQ